MIIYIKNISGSEKIVRGNSLSNGSYLLIPESDRSDWFSDSDIFSSISADELMIAKSDDGLSDIEDYTEQWNYLGNLLPSEFKIAASEKSAVQKALPVTTKRPEGSSATRVSYDLTDKCTWYQKAPKVTSEILTDSGDGKTFNSLNSKWIDLTHGRLYDEDSLADKLEPVIYIDDVIITSGFSIDYDNGNVIFESAQAGAVKADYSYGDSSCFILSPITGKVMVIEHAELQFSKDISMTSAINFEVWVYNPYDLPNKVQYQKIKYKNIRDIINAANLGQGYIPAIAGLVNDVLVFPFNYATVKPFASSVGAELRITIDNDIELSGEWATATFYVLSESE